MINRLKPTYTAASVDQGLISASTYFSLAIIILSQATKETSLSLSESSALAQRMMQLAEDYDNMGAKHFQPFSSNVTPASGGLIQNRNRGPNYARSVVSPSISVRRRKR